MKRADINDLPTASEFPIGMQAVTSDSRDFARPALPFQSNSYSMDADDGAASNPPGDPFVRSVQQFLASHPLGIAYDESPNGTVSSTTLDALNAFQSKLNQLTGKNLNFVSGTSIRQSAFLEAMQTLREYKKSIKAKPIVEKSTPIENKIVPDDKNIDQNLTKQFQDFFSNVQPIVGKLYSGPSDGIINSDLINAAKSAENSISKGVGTSAGGMLWSDSKQTFVTTPDDLAGALELLFKKSTK